MEFPQIRTERAYIFLCVCHNEDLTRTPGLKYLINTLFQIELVSSSD
jgi:hypothetical protein